MHSSTEVALTHTTLKVCSLPKEAHADICGHMWVSTTETHAHICPCSTGGSTSRQNIPAFVDTDYYCKSGFVTSYPRRIAWEDPLWDGAGCVTPGNTCCQRYSWFHKQVQQTSDNIEVRWCANDHWRHEDVVTDVLELCVQ